VSNEVELYLYLVHQYSWKQYYVTFMLTT